MTKTKHISVMTREILSEMSLINDGVYVDATFGGGGHTMKLMDSLTDRNCSGCRIVAFDQDKNALEMFDENYKDFKVNKTEQFGYELSGNKIKLINSNFDNLVEELSKLEIQKIDGLIADVGISTDQLIDRNRGFSFKGDSPIDLRMNKKLGVTGADLLNALSEKQLADSFYNFGDIRQSKVIAKEIIKQRTKKAFKSMEELKLAIDKAVPDKYQRRLYARVLQVLRIIVNNEIDALEEMLEQSMSILNDNGVIAVISFHSGEDRIVKNTFREYEKDKRGVSKLVLPSSEEIENNPKSSSAKLRIFKHF